MTTRPIIAILIRRGQAVLTRHYARLDTALPRVTSLANAQACPRDVIALSHAVTGLEIGTIKRRPAKGKAHLETSYVWEN